jgi:hypothetical protein
MKNVSGILRPSRTHPAVAPSHRSGMSVAGIMELWQDRKKHCGAVKMTGRRNQRPITHRVTWYRVIWRCPCCSSYSRQFDGHPF